MNTEEKPKHTPRPWQWNGSTQGSNFKITCAEGHVIDSVSYEGAWLARYNMEEDAANARLMASAPDLLAALEDLLARYTSLVESGDAGNWDPEKEPEVIAARAALAKANQQS